MEEHGRKHIQTMTQQLKKKMSEQIFTYLGIHEYLFIVTTAEVS